MTQRTGLLTRVTRLSLLSVALVMGVPLGTLSAQAQISPGGTMAPARSNIVIPNDPRTAVMAPAALARAADAANPGISLTPREGSVGGKAAVSGSGFVPDGTITVTFDGSSVSTSCTTDAHGSFSSCAFNVPVAAAGSHALTASDSTANAASAIFTNAAAASDTNPVSVSSGTGTNPLASDLRVPGIGLLPTSGVVGSREPVGGAGFAPHSSITLTFDGVRLNDPRTCVTDAIGRFDCAFTVPPAITGHHTVAASDTRYMNSAAAIYSVNPAITLQDTEGAADSQDVIIGSGFAPHSPIAFGFDDDSAQGPPCTSDAKGSFRCPFIVPETAAGAHTLTAVDNTFTNGVSATFTVNPSISVSATKGTVGSSPAVSGNGFEPNSPIALTFDGSSVATSCVADANGSFSSCTVIVPAVPAGSHTVTASDSNANAAAAIYGVTPAIGLMPSVGPVGSRAAVSGRGFAPGPITVRVDGSSVDTDCKANAMGSFDYCAFTVPDASEGTHKVTVSDGENSAWGTYTVIPGVSLNPRTGALNPTPGAAASTVTLSGSHFKPNSTITVTFDGSPLSTSGTCTTDASGKLPASHNCAFTVPAAAAGTHAVTASDGTYSGNAVYTVKPAISLNASADAASGSDVVNGSGFAANSPIRLTFDGSSVPTSCPADATGSFSSCVFTSPVASLGTHTVTALDRYGNAASVSYTINPALSLSSSAGVVGSTVTLSGSNYLPNSNVTVKVDGTLPGTSGTCTADAKGNLPTTNPCTFIVPAKSAGSYSVSVSDGTYTGSATYTVNAAISMTPNTGPVGSSIAVSGTGFLPYGTITVAFGTSSSSTSCTADATGSFSSCALIVPAVAAGPYTVGATDGSATSALLSNPYSASASYANYAQATYTVVPSVSLSPNAGVAGSAAAISGSNFAPNRPIAVTFDGSVPVTTTAGTSCTSDATGSFSSCAYIIPVTSVGAHTVTASDGTNLPGTAFFTVNPPPTATPAPTATNTPVPPTSTLAPATATLVPLTAAPAPTQTPTTTGTLTATPLVTG